MDSVGCTTPFDKNLESICTDSSLAKEAMKIYKKEHKNPSCLIPCKFLNRFAKFTNILMERKDNTRLLVVSFKKYISKSKAFLTYSGLDLFAAVGGYVGLCLGFSILDIRNGFSFVIRKVNNLQAKY